MPGACVPGERAYTPALMPTTTPRSTKKSRRANPAAPAKLTARTADRHELYQAAVQNVEAEIDFVDRVYRKLRGRPAARLREDFCGTGNTSCEWVRRRKGNVAVGLDIDAPTLAWGMKHNVARLTEEQRSRIHLLERDVLKPGPRTKGNPAVGVDCVLAMNFSYYLFMERRTLLEYFRSVHRSLAPDGVFFQDQYGGAEAHTVTVDRKPVTLDDGRKFTYLWDQHGFNPIDHEMDCRIHFEFPDGTRMRNAFRYHWRLWSLPELRELLAEAGFRKTTVYWEGDDGEGGGNGIFRPTERGEPCPAFICYLVSEK